MDQKLRRPYVRDIGKNWSSDGIFTSTIDDFPFASDSVMFVMFDQQSRLIHYAKALEKKHQAIYSQYLLFAIRCVDGVPWFYFVDDREECRTAILAALEVDPSAPDPWSKL